MCTWCRSLRAVTYLNKRRWSSVSSIEHTPLMQEIGVSNPARSDAEPFEYDSPRGHIIIVILRPP